MSAERHSAASRTRSPHRSPHAPIRKTNLDAARQLIGTPSVSSTDPSWDQGNRAVIDLLAGWLDRMGFRTEIQDITAAAARPT